MTSRTDLRDTLRKILGNNERVYFQPTESIKLKYPCFIYQLDDYNLIKASNGNHKINESYSVTLITTLPDETISKQMLELPYCSFDRVFISDNLYHYVFTIYL